MEALDELIDKALDHEYSGNYPFKTIEGFSIVSGYTKKAIRRKIETHQWRHGEHYIKSRDGRIHIFVPRITEWVIGK